MSPSGAPAPLSELADTLALERRLLEYLHFKLVVANLILTTSEASQFVALAVGEVDQVMRRVRDAERYRGGVVGELAENWGVRVGDLSLEYLAANSPDPLRQAFEEHRAAFMELVDAIERVTLDNRRLASVNLDAIRDTLGIAAGTEAAGTEAVGTYDGMGRRDDGPGHPAHLDRAI